MGRSGERNLRSFVLGVCHTQLCSRMTVSWRGVGEMSNLQSTRSELRISSARVSVGFLRGREANPDSAQGSLLMVLRGSEYRVLGIELGVSHMQGKLSPRCAIAPALSLGLLNPEFVKDPRAVMDRGNF